MVQVAPARDRTYGGGLDKRNRALHQLADQMNRPLKSQNAMMAMSPHMHPPTTLAAPWFLDFQNDSDPRQFLWPSTRHKPCLRARKQKLNFAPLPRQLQTPTLKRVIEFFSWMSSSMSSDRTSFLCCSLASSCSILHPLASPMVLDLRLFSKAAWPFSKNSFC